MKNKLRQLKKQIELALENKIDTPSRKRPLTYARAVFCKIAREELGVTLSEVGEVLNRDHATVMHSIRVVFPFAMQESRFETLYNVLRDEYKPKPKTTTQRIVDNPKDAIEIIEKLKEENATLKKKMDKYVNEHSRLFSMTCNLSDEEIDEVYEKLNLFVQVAIKSRVYI